MIQIYLTGQLLSIFGPTNENWVW